MACAWQEHACVEAQISICCLGFGSCRHDHLLATKGENGHRYVTQVRCAIHCCTLMQFAVKGIDVLHKAVFFQINEESVCWQNDKKMDTFREDGKMDTFKERCFFKGGGFDHKCYGMASYQSVQNYFE